MGSASIEARLLRSQLTDPIPPSSFYALSGSRGAGGEGGFPRSAPQPPVAGSSEPRMKKEGHHRPQSQSPLASRVFRVGKFAGKTFSEVAASDPSYCRWALGLNAPSGQVAEFVEFLRKPRPFQHAALSSPSPPEAAGGVSFAHRGGLPLPDASAAQISLGTTALDPQTNAPPLWEGKGKGGLLLPEEKPVDDAEAAAAVDAWACDDGFGGVVDFEVELEVEDSQQQQSEGPPARPSLHELPALHQHHHNHQPQNPVWPQAVSAQSPLSVVREECSVLKMWEGQAPPCLSPKDETSRGRRAALEELDAFAFKSEGESCAEAASPPHPKAPGAPAVVGSVPEPVDACLSVEICGKALFRVVSLEQAPRKRLALAAGGGGSSSLLPRGGAGFAASGSSSRRGKGNVWSPQLPRPVADFLRTLGKGRSPAAGGAGQRAGVGASSSSSSCSSSSSWWSRELDPGPFPAEMYLEVTEALLKRFAFELWEPLPPFVLLAFAAFRRFAPRMEIPKKTWRTLNPGQVCLKPVACPDATQERREKSPSAPPESGREVRLEPSLYASLRDFQKEGVAFGLERQGRVLIADEMGLGKTVQTGGFVVREKECYAQALTIAAHFLDDWPLLVVCPSSIRFQWRDQALRWLSHLVSEDEICIVRNGKTDVPLHTRIIIISYDLLALQEKFKARYQCVICDESHYLKNPKAKRTQVICPILKDARRVILLSGTPALNRPAELFQQVNALLPEFCTYRDFCARYSVAILNTFTRRLEEDGHQHEEELHLLLTNTVMIRRLKSQVLTQLPDKLRSRVPVEVSAKALAEIRSKMGDYDASDLVKETEGPGGPPSDNGASGRSLVSELFALTGRAKLPAVCEYLSYLLQLQEQERSSQAKDAPHTCKCLVFAHHIAVLDGLETFVQKKEKRNYVRIDGSCSLKEREERVKKFQTSSECQGLVVFAELYWVPGFIMQAEDRSHRIGNEHKSVQIHYLIAEGTIDDAVYRQLQQKWSVMTAALDGKQQVLSLQSHTGGGAALAQCKRRASLLSSGTAPPSGGDASSTEGEVDGAAADLAPSPAKQRGNSSAPQQQLIFQYFKKTRLS